MRQIRTRTPILYGLVIMLAALFTPTVHAQQTADRERIIDVSQLTEAMQRATEPIGQRLRTSKLKEQFEVVNELLRQPEIDKRELIDALNGLQGEIGAFTDDWDQVAAPLWEGQGAIGKTIDRVRSLLARGEVGQPSERTEALLQNYDKRLTSLAKAIEQETDEVRRDRLKIVFANVLGLKDLTKKAGSINLGPAREAVFVRIIRALEGVETQLTSTAFSLEKARIVLTSQAEWVELYADTLGGLVAAEDILKMLDGMEESEFDFGFLVTSLSGLARQGDQFTKSMDGLMEGLVETISEENARLEENFKADLEFAGLDIDEAIKRYAGTNTKVTANNKE